MSILRAMDGKFYDVPDDKVAAYAVPQDKLDAVLEQSGVMKPQGSPKGSAQGSAQGSPSGGGAPGSAPGGGAPGPVIVQIYAQPPAQGGAPAPSSEGGDVDPYWWYRYYYVRPWYNYWGNW